jgi:hypothetical protein
MFSPHLQVVSPIGPKLPDHPLADPDIKPQLHPRLPAHVARVLGAPGLAETDGTQSEAGEFTFKVRELEASQISFPRWIAVIEVDHQSEKTCAGPTHTSRAVHVGQPSQSAEANRTLVYCGGFTDHYQPAATSNSLRDRRFHSLAS